MSAAGVQASRTTGSIDLRDTTVPVSISINSWARVCYVVDCLRSVTPSNGGKPRFPLRHWNFSGYLFTLFNLGSLGIYITIATAGLPSVDNGSLRLLLVFLMSLAILPSFVLDVGLFLYFNLTVLRLWSSNYVLYVNAGSIEGSMNRFLTVTATISSEQTQLMAASSELRSVIMACRSRVGVSGAVHFMIYVSAWYNIYIRYVYLWLLFCIGCEILLMAAPIAVFFGAIETTS